MCPCFYLMLQTCSKCLTRGQVIKIICECAHGAFHTCCVTVCFLQHLSLFSCMFAYTHVCVSVCVWQTHMVHLAFASVIWSARCQCVPEPLSFSSSRGPEPHVCVCLFVCIALQEEANTVPVKVIMNCVYVRGVVFTCVY